MLLAVEGGGFFSSSASGYSKGLTLLLLGEKHEEKPMRVTPWNHYQLEEQEKNPDLQLASGKNRLVRGCAYFVCFGRAAAGHENLSPLKVGPTHSQEVSREPVNFEDSKEDHVHSVDQVDVDDDSARGIISRKSSLKRSVNIAPAAVGNPNMHAVLCEKDSVDTFQLERRKVKWADTTGGDLFEIREFEMSEDGSDDEFDHGSVKTCSCSIM